MTALRSFGVLAVLATSGCVTYHVEKARIDPIELKTHEDRLLQPFQLGHTIACQVLRLEVNPVFSRHLTLPAGAKRVKTPDYDEIRWHKDDRIALWQGRVAGSGARRISDMPAPQGRQCKIQIGSTWFLVDESLTVRFPHKAAPTLTAIATGHVMVTKDGKTANYYSEVRFADGEVRTKKIASASSPRSVRPSPGPRPARR